MNKIDLVSLDLQGQDWNESEENRKAFYLNDTDDLILNYFGLPPDIAAINDSEVEIQNNYRKVAFESGGAIIEVKKITLDSFDAIKTIFKFPMQPSGMAYIGSYTIPFKNCSYVIKVQCPEVGTTGVRDTVILELMTRKGIVKFENNKMKGWMSDPYDKNQDLPLMMNLAEKEEFDSMFPEHPLTRLRKYLLHIENSVTIDRKLHDEPKFIYGI